VEAKHRRRPLLPTPSDGLYGSHRQVGNRTRHVAAASDRDRLNILAKTERIHRLPGSR
jgi:hypothetical protein